MTKQSIQLSIKLTTVADPSSLAFNILSDLAFISKPYVPMTVVLDHFNLEEGTLYSVPGKVRGAISRHGTEYVLGINPNLSSAEQRLELGWLLSWFLHTNIRDLIPDNYTVHHVAGAGNPDVISFNDRFASSLLVHHIPERVVKRLIKDTKGTYTSKYARKRLVPTRILLNRLADSITVEF